MATAHWDYMVLANANVNYKHKKFSNRITGEISAACAPNLKGPTKLQQQPQQRLFRPYALSENTSRKRRFSVMQADHQPATTTTTVSLPTHQQQMQHPQYNTATAQIGIAAYQHTLACTPTPSPTLSMPPTPPSHPIQYHHQQQQQYYPTHSAYHGPSTAPPTLNHQVCAVILQKQRAALQMRQMLLINPDATTWPLEWRNALYNMLYN